VFEYTIEIEGATLTFKVEKEDITLLIPGITKIYTEDNSPNWYSIIIVHNNKEIVVFRNEDFAIVEAMKKQIVDGINRYYINIKSFKEAD